MTEKLIQPDPAHVTQEHVEQAKQEAAFLAARADLMEANPVEFRRQCTATNRAGSRCGRAPIPGGVVCDKHGGKAPQTIAAAQARLRSLVEPVLEVFAEIVDKWRDTRCDKCGQPTADPGPVIRIGQLVLDRSGLGPSATLTVAPAEAPVGDASLEWLTADEFDTLRNIFSEATRRQRAGEPKPESALTLDAVYVEGEEAEEC